MNALFEKININNLLNPIQGFLNKNMNEFEYLQFEEHLGQVLNDLSNLQYALDSSIIVAATDVKGNILYVNDKFCEISKFSRKELLGKSHRLINSAHHDKSFFKNMWKTIGKGEVWEGEVKNKAKDGSFYWVKTTVVPIKDQNDKAVMYISLRTDITEGKLAQERLVEALQNDFKLVVNSMNNLIFKVERKPNYEFIYTLSGGMLANKLGIDEFDMYYKSPKELFPLEIAEILQKKYEQAFLGEPVTFTHSFKQRSLLTYLSPIYEKDQVVEVIGCVSDITELVDAEKEIKYMAYHDLLTNLPNRRKMNEDMLKLIHIANNRNKRFAVFFLDIDRFKQINDSLGHNTGDILIKEVSNRLRKGIGSKGSIFRFAGDEFIIVFSNIDNKTINQYGQEILSIFEEAFTLTNSFQITATPSIGISIFPEHGEDFDTLLKNADTAMFVAKSNGRNTFELYDSKMNQHHEEFLLIENHLRQAIKNKEFELYFQPKLDLVTDEINSMEVLLRWKNPVLGNVSPDKFIPIAEDTGFIIKIDEWVLEQACLQNKEWNDCRIKDSTPLRVAVNISPLHFRLSNFVKKVEDVLKKTELAPELLEIEITEGSFLGNTDECMESLKRLREIGVYIALDDFGKGYSSLNYLRKFPITSLKIDRAFIQEITINNDDIAIVKAMIFLSH